MMAAYLIFGLIALCFGSTEAGFCTVPYDCDSTCYRMSTYKTLCGTRECYRSRLEPYICKETCYRKDCCQGFTGEDCLTPTCFGDMTCPNGGRCVAPDTCNCLPGFYGEKCSACGILPSVTNGQFKLHTTGASTDTVARLECAAGYIQRPDPNPQFELQCDTDGFWSPNIIPVTCDILDCGNLNRTVPYGQYLAVNGTHFGNQALLHCDPGYSPERDAAFVECQETGMWSESATKCVQACSPGWISFESSCYFFVLIEMNYTDARRICLEQNSTLVQIDTNEENSFLKNKMLQLDTENNSPTWGYWNDLFETTVNGQEVWRESNTPLNPLVQPPFATVADWIIGQPDDRTGNQSCTMFFKNHLYSWADIECDAVNKPDTVYKGTGFRLGRPVCEQRIITLI